MRIDAVSEGWMQCVRQSEDFVIIAYWWLEVMTIQDFIQAVSKIQT